MVDGGGAVNVWQNWRSQLPLLQGFPLVPCGAGEKGKAPIDPDTGHPARHWQMASYSPEQIAAMNGVVRCVGTRCGPDAGELLILDIDGPTAVAKCAEYGCTPSQGVGWVIRRNTDPSRLKVAFRVTGELCSCLAGKHVLKTKPAVYANDSSGNVQRDADNRPIVLEKQEAIELFFGTGQCIVLGEHIESGGYYYWEGSPAQIAAPTEAWGHLINAVLMGSSVETTQRISHARPRGAKGQTQQSGPRTPCPICGRNTTSACTTFIDGERRRVNCFDGQTFQPPGGLKHGDTITIAGVTWAFTGDGRNPSIGPFSTFVEHRDRPLPAGSSGVAAAPPTALPGGVLLPNQQQEPDPDDAADDRAALALELKQFRDLDQMAAELTLERVFPPGLASSITAYANEQQLDPRGFLLPVLTTAISMVGNRAMVAAEPCNDWREPAVLWGMNITDASGGKTPTSRPAISDALKHQQKREVDKYKRELAEWKRGKTEAERKAKEAKAEGSGDDGNDDPVAMFLAENPQPDLRHITVTDATFEKIETILAGENNPALLAFYDELARWFSQLCRNPQQNDRSKWLSLYSGSPIKTDRIGRESVLVTDPVVSIFGNIQPTRLEGLWKADAAANDGEADGDGLWSRFLMYNLGDWNYRYRSSTIRLAPVLGNLYEQINAEATKLQQKPDNDVPVLALAPDALPLFITWIDQLESLKRGAREPADRQYIGKQRGTTLRLALALHGIHQAGRGLRLDTSITKDTLQSAVLLTALFIVEREKALAPLRSQAAGAIKRLLSKGKEWRREHGAEPVTVRTLRDWCLPERNATAKAVRDWLRQVVGTAPGAGRVEGQGRGLVWLPPGDLS
ncbi:MAG: DUF3987 domain-containing protein [Cyanobacteriota bacterium]